MTGRNPNGGGRAAGRRAPTRRPFPVDTQLSTGLVQSTGLLLVFGLQSTGPVQSTGLLLVFGLQSTGPVQSTGLLFVLAVTCRPA